MGVRHWGKQDGRRRRRNAPHTPPTSPNKRTKPMPTRDEQRIAGPVVGRARPGRHRAGRPGGLRGQAGEADALDEERPRGGGRAADHLCCVCVCVLVLGVLGPPGDRSRPPLSGRNKIFTHVYVRTATTSPVTNSPTESAPSSPSGAACRATRPESSYVFVFMCGYVVVWYGVWIG